MVIVHLGGGLGNQFFQYAFSRCLAYKLNTELKLDLRSVKIFRGGKPRVHGYYSLVAFNILENIATPEEIKHVQETGIIPTSMKNLKDIQGDVFIQGSWMFSRDYIECIIDIIRKEFTLKKPFSPNAEMWKNKILSAEYSVSMHFRHGDKLYNPRLQQLHKWWTVTLSLDYYYTCIDILKQRYKNLTVFVFSDNLQWCKENLHLDVPTEFIEGCETDEEEFILMSLCKYNICANSTFSRAASILNSNPDKKVFYPKPSTLEEVDKFIKSLIPSQKDSLLVVNDIFIPFDLYNQPEITLPPIFSLLLIVNNDVSTIAKTLDSLLGQDYKYYEVIIIDNVSTDGSEKICRQYIDGKKNVTYKRLRKKVSNVVAWNRALKMAQGKYISFLKSSDSFLVNTLSTLYFVNKDRQVDILQLFAWLEEDENGTITVGDKKYSEKRDAFFQKQTKPAIMSANGQGVAKLLIDQQINRFLGTKIFYRDFLLEKGIKFDEHLPDDEAELFFQVECFFKSKYFMHVANALYIAPRK